MSDFEYATMTVDGHEIELRRRLGLHEMRPNADARRFMTGVADRMGMQLRPGKSPESWMVVPRELMPRILKAFDAEG